MYTEDETYDYSKVFKIGLISQYDKSVAIGTFKKGKRRLKEAEDECFVIAGLCESKEKTFSWEVIAHNETNLIIQTEFDKPNIISTSVYG